jgi:hypothetical protein
MQPIPNFTETELWIIRSTVKERYGKDIPVELADTEIRLHPGAKELSDCPAAYWEEGGAHFVIVKTGQDRYRAQFYYRLHQIFGTGIDQYDDIGDCVVTLLRVQADHAAQSRHDS